MNTFAELVNEIQQLSMEELEELHSLTEKYLIELRREQFLKDHEASLKEYREGKLIFTNDIKKLREQLDNL